MSHVAGRGREGARGESGAGERPMRLRPASAATPGCTHTRRVAADNARESRGSETARKLGIAGLMYVRNRAGQWKDKSIEM